MSEIKFPKFFLIVQKKEIKMEIDPFDERDLYNKPRSSSANRNELVSTTISTIVVHGGPLQLVIALLRVRRNMFLFIKG